MVRQYLDFEIPYLGETQLNSTFDHYPGGTQNLFGVLANEAATDEHRNSPLSHVLLQDVFT